MVFSNRNVKLTILVILSMLGSCIPFVFVAPLIRLAYLNFSRVGFWLSYLGAIGLLILGGAQPLAISLMGITLCVGLYSSIYSRMKSMFVAGWIAVSLSSVATVAATQQWLVLKGSSLSFEIQKQVEIIAKQAHVMSPGLQERVLVPTLVGLAPSSLVSIMILALGLSLIFETSVSRLFHMEPRGLREIDLLQFKLPDSYIWIAMFSFLMSFVNTGYPLVSTIASNILHVLAILYFFQGLAVTESLFRALRFGFFIRFMTYVVFVFQLFTLVIAVGVIDFWVEFRKRFLRMRLNF